MPAFPVPLQLGVGDAFQAQIFGPAAPFIDELLTQLVVWVSLLIFPTPSIAPKGPGIFSSDGPNIINGRVPRT